MRKILVILLCLVAIFALGCNTETKTDANADASTDAQTDTNSKASTDASIKADVKADVNIDTKVEVPAGKSLKDILSGKLVKYTADYTLDTQGKQMTFTMAIDLPKVAYHMKLLEGETKMVMDGEKIHSCTNSQGSWMCVMLDAPTPMASEELEKDVTSGEVQTTFVGTCTVAGETGNKYKTESKDSEGSVCYTSDGILLEMETMRPQTSTMRATHVSRTVVASSFELPAESKDISAMIPEGMMIPQN